MFDPARIRQVAIALKTDARYVEKDWHLVRALGVIAAIDVAGVTPAFSGGTSLSAAWRLVHRFSEDVDFKVTIDAPNAAAASRLRRAYRDEVVRRLVAAGFVLDGEPLVGNRSQFFRVSFHYGPTFPDATGIRAGLQIEMTFSGTLLPPLPRPVQSLLSRTLRAEPEIERLMCIDPVETAADKISALAWRAAARDRMSATDDPSIVRHLHDLAALAATVRQSTALSALASGLLHNDAARAGRGRAEGQSLLRAMLPTIEGDTLWRREYEQFVSAVCFGSDAERISFDQALAGCRELVTIVLDGQSE